MRKLSEINEGLFTNTIRRGYTDEVRKEDEFDGKTNTSNMGYAVNINNLLWADDILEVNYNDEAGVRLSISINKFNEIPKKHLNGWRLPKKEDFENLVKSGYTYSTYDEIKVFEKPKLTGPFIKFEDDYLYMMEEDEDGCNCVRPTVSNDSKFTYLTVEKDLSGKWGKHIIIILVKDKI